MPSSRSKLTRRQALAVGAGAAASGLAGLLPVPAQATTRMRLVAKPSSIGMVGASYPKTEVWSYDGEVPGPVIRVRQGERLRVAFENRLAEETTVHWHGIRLPNAMDGVPHVTQDPVPPGGRFVYEFEPPDAGTYWYHPHTRSSVQVGRGLYGALVVEEPRPPKVDRDLVWMLDDWRMTREAAIVDDFGNRHDQAHAGRLGNTVTVNGLVPEQLRVGSGERIRLRLVNAANARIFALRFTDHEPVIIALDGQPCEPHEAPDGRIVLGPAMRADVILDMNGTLGRHYPVIDDFDKNTTYRLLDLSYDTDAPRRWFPLFGPGPLPANPLPEPDLANAVRHEVLLEGGAMGGMAGAYLKGQLESVESLNKKGKFWSLNSIVAHGHMMPPLLTFERGQSVVLEMYNDSFFDHPMHLHGHSFRVLTRDGKPVPNDVWRDTVLVARQERVEVAFVADNPGDWMFHCHILEHQEAGMMSIVRVT